MGSCIEEVLDSLLNGKDINKKREVIANATSVIKKSIDSRKDIIFSYQVLVTIENEDKYLSHKEIVKIINTIYDGVLMLIVLIFGLLIALLGTAILTNDKSNSGEAFAGFFAVLGAIVAAVVAIACGISLVSGIITNVKARKGKADEHTLIKSYFSDSTKKVVLNGLIALSSVSTIIKAINDGNIKTIIISIFIFIFAGLSIWQFIEVLILKIKEND